MSDITLLTEMRYRHLDMGHWYHRQIALEEGLLLDALACEGLSAERQAWDDPMLDWASAGMLVFRSTWNYFDAIEHFRPWLDAVPSQSRCINDPSLIRWNMDKHYLAGLDGHGVPVVPTRFVDASSPCTLARVMDETGWSEVVIKPAIGGAARLTWRANRDNLPAHEAVLADCLQREDMLVQPFQAAIERSGEVSVIVVGEHITHGVRKLAKAGDFRVQDDHGGTVHPHEVTTAEARVARSAVEACPSRPHYARVDLVDSEDGPRVMELELIEPELFLRHHPSAAAVLAREIARACG